MTASRKLAAIEFVTDLENRASSVCAPLTLRAGIATGHALLFEGDDYIGSAVNMAARLCDYATGFDVLMPTMQLDRLPEGVTAQPGTVAVNQAGNALGNAILWMDMRGAPYLHRPLRGLINIDGADVFKVLRFVRLTGGMPSMTGKDPAAHMLFIRETMPDVYARTHKFLNVLDYMNLRLTGEFVASFDSIVTSWVTDNRKPDDIHYETL